jgi:hypothetical protein
VLDAWERSVTTDAAGNYKFANLPNGNHRIRVVVQTGWRPTDPAPGYYDFPQTTDMVTWELNFLLTQKVMISGSVFNDLDGDGKKDSGEAGLAGWKVFLDADNNGVLDSGGKNLLTDSGGNWKFDNLAAGTYHVRVVQQSGWTRTTPSTGSYDVTLTAGKTSTGKLFGQKR